MFENYNFEGEIKVDKDERIEYIQQISSELNGIEKYVGLVVNATSLYNLEIRLIAPVIKYDVKLFELTECPDEDTVYLEYGAYERLIEDLDEFKREINYFFEHNIVQGTIENVVKQVKSAVKKYKKEQAELAKEGVDEKS